MMEPSSLRRPAAALALFALAACGPAGQVGATPSGSSSTPAASPSGTGEKTGGKTTSESPSPDGTRHDKAADDGKRSSAAGDGMCQTGDLSLSTEPAQGSGAGHQITRLVFKNTSGDACWVRGYPGVSYVTGDDGHQVGGAAIRDRSRPPSEARIWLIPNAHAYALLNQPNPHLYPESRCDPTKVRGLRVYPPEETSAMYVPDRETACADDSTGRPEVSALSKSPNQPPS